MPAGLTPGLTLSLGVKPGREPSSTIRISKSELLHCVCFSRDECTAGKVIGSTSTLLSVGQWDDDKPLAKAGSGHSFLVQMTLTPRLTPSFALSVLCALAITYDHSSF